MPVVVGVGPGPKNNSPQLPVREVDNRPWKSVTSRAHPLLRLDKRVASNSSASLPRELDADRLTDHLLCLFGPITRRTRRVMYSESAIWCRGPESNWRHHDFQSCALPTELPRHEWVL